MEKIHTVEDTFKILPCKINVHTVKSNFTQTIKCRGFFSFSFALSLCVLDYKPQNMCWAQPAEAHDFFNIFSLMNNTKLCLLDGNFFLFQFVCEKKRETEFLHLVCIECASTCSMFDLCVTINKEPTKAVYFYACILIS